MKSCKEIHAICSSGSFDSLPIFQKILHQMHLWICKRCRDVSRQLRWIDKTARTLFEEEYEQKKKNLQQRILRSLEK